MCSAFSKSRPDANKGLVQGANEARGALIRMLPGGHARPPPDKRLLLSLLPGQFHIPLLKSSRSLMDVHSVLPACEYKCHRIGKNKCGGMIRPQTPVGCFSIGSLPARAAANLLMALRQPGRQAAKGQLHSLRKSKMSKLSN